MMLIMTRLNEGDLKERARIWNLRLLSDYEVYGNIHSKLQWECLECGHKFSSSIYNINQRKFPCPECGRTERELPFYDKNKGIKECGWCHRILLLSDFDRTATKRREKGGLQSYMSICRKCAVDLKLIRKFRKKYRLVTEHFNGRCYFCGEDISLILLPSSHFHHPNPELKTSTWHIMRRKCYKEILKWAIKDKVVPLCANCHINQQSQVVKVFEDLILERDLFQNTAKEIDKSIDLSIVQNPETRNYNGDKKSKLKIAVKQWMRKRFVIEQLSNGLCVGCGSVNVFNNLPAFVINHLEPSKKQSEWLNLRDLDCEEILKMLIRESCVWICANCHWIIHSIFHKLSGNILKDFFSEDSIENIEFKIQQDSKEIIKRVNNFTIRLNKIEFCSPLKLEFNQWNIWKTYLLKLYYLAQKLETDYFTINQIFEHLDKSIHTHRYHLKRLLNKGVIEKQMRPGFLNRYKLTPKGVLEVINTESEYKRTSKEIKDSFRK